MTSTPPSIPRQINPIDIVMTVKRYSFMQAVRYLDPILDQLLARERNRQRLRLPLQTRS